MPNEEKLKSLYNGVSKDYDIGTYEEFSQKMQIPEKREAFYNGVGAEYDLGDYKTFENKIGLGKPSAVPSSGLDGGSATKGRSVELRSTLPTTLTAKDVQTKVEQAVPAAELANIDYEQIAQKMQGKTPMQAMLEQANQEQDPVKKVQAKTGVYKLAANEASVKNTEIQNTLKQFEQGLEQMKGEIAAGEQEYNQLLGQDVNAAEQVRQQLEQQVNDYNSALEQAKQLDREYNQNATFISTMNAGRQAEFRIAQAKGDMQLGKLPIGTAAMSNMFGASMPFSPTDAFDASAWNAIAPNLVRALSAVTQLVPFTGEAGKDMGDSLLSVADAIELETEKYTPKSSNVSLLDERNMYNVSKAAGSLVGSIAGSLGSGGMAGGTGAMVFNASQGFGDMYGWGKKAGLSSNKAIVLSLPVAAVYGYLGVKGVESVAGMFGNQSFKKLIQEGVKGLGEKPTQEALLTLGKRLLVDGLKGASREGIQEGLEFTTEFGTKKFAQDFGIVNVDDDLSMEAFEKGLLESIAVGAVGGGIFGAGLGSARSSIADVAAQAKKDPKVREQYVADVNSLVQSGKITNEEADQATAALDKAIEITNKIPNNVTNEQAISEAVQLIEEKEQLTAEIENIEPAMAKPMAERVASIDQRLSDIAEGKSETTVEDINSKLDSLTDRFVNNGKTQKEAESLALQSITEQERQVLRDSYNESLSSTKGRNDTQQEGLTSVEQPVTPNETIDLTPKEETSEVSPSEIDVKGEVTTPNETQTTNTTQNATKEGNFEQDNQQERQGTIGQQQGGQENRVNQEGDVAKGKTETSSGNSVEQSGAEQEVVTSPFDAIAAIAEELQKEVSAAVEPQTKAAKAKKVANGLRNLKVDTKTMTFSSLPFVPQAYNAALEAAAIVVEQTGNILDAIDAAIKAIKEHPEYKALNDAKRREVEKDLATTLREVLGDNIEGTKFKVSKFVSDLQASLKSVGASKGLIERLNPEYQVRNQDAVVKDAEEFIALVGEEMALGVANAKAINLDTAVYIIAKNYANAKKAYDANPSPETEAALEQAFTDFNNIAKQVGRGTSMFQKVRQDFPEIFVEEFIASVDKSLDRAMGTNPNNPNSDMKPASEVAKQVPKVKEDVWNYLARVVGGDILPKNIGTFQRKANSALRFLVSFGVKLDAKTRDGLSQMLAKLATDGQLANAKNKEEVAKLVKDNLVDMNSRLGGVFTNAQMDEMIDGFVYLYEQLAQKKISQLIDAAFRNNKKSISGVTNSKIAKELLYGVLTDAETRRKFAAKYGLPTLNQTQVNNLNRLAANVANSKGGAKATANNTLNNYIASLNRQASVNPLVRVSDKFEMFTAFFINNILVYPATIATAFASSTSRTFGIVIDDLLSGRGNNVKKAFDTKVEIEFPGGKKQLLQRTKDAIMSAVLGVSKLSEYRLQGLSKQEQNIRETKSRWKRNVKRTFLTSSNRILAATDASVMSIASYLTKRQMYEALVKQAYIKQGLKVPNKATLQSDVDAIVGVDNQTLVAISQQAMNDVINGTFYQSLVADGRIDPNKPFPDASSRSKILTPEAEVFNEYMVRMYELMDDGVNDRLLDLQARRGWDKVTDITEQQMEVEKFIARRTNEIIFYGRPAGTFGTLADAIVSISSKLPVLKYVGYMPLFVNASMNGVAMIVKTTPALNIVQLLKYKAMGRRGFGKKEFENEYIVKIDQKNMLKSVIASNTLAVAAYALLSGLYDDKDDEIKAWKEGRWTGICTNLTQGQKALGRDATDEPYEEGWYYKNGKRSFNFKQSPFYGWFEGVGYMKNSKVFTEKWNDDKLFVEDDPEFKEAVGGYVLNSMYTLTDASALRDFSSMFYTVFGKQKQDVESSFDERAAKDLERRAAGFIKNLIPLGRLQQGIKDAVDAFNGDEKLMATTFTEKLALNTLLEDYYVKSNYTDPFGRPLKERLDMGGMTVGFNTFEIADGKFISPADRMFSGDEYMSLYIDRNYAPNARIEMNVPVTVDYDTFLQEEGEDAEEFDIAGLLGEFKEKGIETSVKEGDRKGEIKSFTYTYKLDEQERADINERMGGMVMSFVKQTGNMDVLKGNEELPITDTKFRSVMNSVYAISKRILIYEKFKKELGEPYRMTTYKALESLASSLADDNITIPDNWKDMLEAQ